MNMFDEPPPPPYSLNPELPASPEPFEQSPIPPQPSSKPQPRQATAKAPRFSSLPPHILLQIIHSSFLTTRPSLSTGTAGELERRVFYWLAKSLRLVNKSCYIACMYLLRTTYLPSYNFLLHPFYSSDPFPSAFVPQAYSSTLNTVLRETPVLDLFIALRAREDVLKDDSELHLQSEDKFKDIFARAQPKARLEDLVRTYGVEEGLITLLPPGVVTYTSPGFSSYSLNSTVHNEIKHSEKKSPPLSPPSFVHPHSRAPPPTPRRSTSRLISAIKLTPRKAPPARAARWVSSRRQPRLHVPPHRPSPKIRPIPFSLLSITFGTRKVRLQLKNEETGSKRTVLEVQRLSKDERLETTAARIVQEMRGLLT